MLLLEVVSADADGVVFTGLNVQHYISFLTLDTQDTMSMSSMLLNSR